MSSNNPNPIPQGRYVPAVRKGSMIFTAGMTPRKNGVLCLKGQVLNSKSPETYREAARLAASNALIAARNLLGDGEKIQCVMNTTVFVNAESGYTEHSKIADFVSDFLYEELGEPGIGCRTAVGVASLPGDAPIEVQMIFMTA